MHEHNAKGARSTVGVLGVVATVLSIWWFALRPRRRRRG
jgi:cbb3-type cytochrome oxidase subunit 3